MSFTTEIQLANFMIEAYKASPYYQEEPETDSSLREMLSHVASQVFPKLARPAATTVLQSTAVPGGDIAATPAASGKTKAATTRAPRKPRDPTLPPKPATLYSRFTKFITAMKNDPTKDIVLENGVVFGFKASNTKAKEIAPLIPGTDLESFKTASLKELVNTLKAHLPPEITGPKITSAAWSLYADDKAVHEQITAALSGVGDATATALDTVEETEE